MDSKHEQQRHTVNRVSLFEMPLDIEVTKQDVLRRIKSGNLLLSYLNPNAYTVAKKVPNYASDLRRFDLVVCDSIGIQAASNAVFKTNTTIISLDYSGIGRDYLQLCAHQKMSLCLVGAELTTVNIAAAKIKERFPDFRSISEFSGYGESLTKSKAFILQSAPDLVLVGMGMGQQESYLLDLVDSDWSGVGICVGGFFDKIANPQVDYPKWTEKTKLRFLGRLIKEPRRLSKRYFIDYQPFIKMYIKHLIKRT